MVVEQILSVFNSVNNDIKFTVEVPEPGNFLSFLDVAIRIGDDGIHYKWHIKPCHSNNSLRADSWVPNHVKTNFLKNAIQNVKEKCSSEQLKQQALKN